MNFKKYIETVNKVIEDKDRVYYTLFLVSDVANLLEKLEYFKNENSLILSGIGDNIFSAFTLMEKCNIEFDDQSLDLEKLKLKIDELDKLYPMKEQEIQKSLVMEVGIISNIITNYMKYNIDEITEDDKNRIKKSLIFYILLLMILTCKYNFSLDRVLEFNVKKKIQNHKELNMKEIKDND